MFALPARYQSRHMMYQSKTLLASSMVSRNILSSCLRIEDWDRIRRSGQRRQKHGPCGHSHVRPTNRLRSTYAIRDWKKIHATSANLNTHSITSQCDLSNCQNPNTSPTLDPLTLTPVNATTISTTSTTTNTIQPSKNLGINTRYSIKCLLRCPAQSVVASCIVA